MPPPRLLPAGVGFPVWPHACPGLDRSDLHVLPCVVKLSLTAVDALISWMPWKEGQRPLPSSSVPRTTPDRGSFVCCGASVRLADLPLGVFCTRMVIQLWVCTHLLPVSGVFFTLSLIYFN